jgi:hypothetical protein
MRVTSLPFIKYCGTRTVCLPGQHLWVGGPTRFLVFCSHRDYFIVTQNSHPSPGLGSVKTIYRDQTTPVHLPGLAKKCGTSTRTPTNQTARPLGLRCALTDNDRETEVNAVSKMGEGPPPVLYRRDLQTVLRCFLGD